MAISDSQALLYIDTQQAVDDFLADISGVREIAVDTEGASFHRFIDRIYLLQITTRERSAIIDPLPIGMPPALGAILQDPDVEVVFHDADYDLRLLHQDYGWHVNRIFDTRITAQLLGIKSFETRSFAADNRGGFACSERDWGAELAFVTGGGLSPTQ